MSRDGPDFFIVGAPKCGTTSLYRYLEANEAVFLSAEKEPGYFCADLPFRNVLDAERYAQLFAGKGHATVAGEGSPWYLYSRLAVPAILGRNPKAKFVVMLRDPALMAVSLHFQHRHDGIEPEASFEAAWLAQKEMHLSEVPKTGEVIPGFPYADACSLGRQLDQLLRWTDREQVLVLFLEDLAAQPVEVLRQVSEFLRIPARMPASFPVHNASRVNRSDAAARAWRAATKRGPGYWLLKRAVNSLGIRPGRWLFEQLVTREAGYQPPPARLTNAMRERFRPEVEQLERLTGRRLDHWLAAATDA